MRPASPPRRAARGLTLVELMIALLVSAIVIAAAFALMTAQQRAFRAGSDERQLQDSARAALEEISTNLRMAGYGIDPSLAFDFGALTAFPMPESPALGGAGATPGYACDTAVSCRDRTDGPDELVFRHRDPMFGHRFVAAPSGTTQITIDGPIPELYAGQVLQLVCQSGSMSWAYVTVQTSILDESTRNADTVTVTLQAGDNNNYAHQNAVLATDTCFTAVAAKDAAQPAIDAAVKVLKVDLYRYHVAQFGGRPYLMLDRGFGTDDLVASDVEDLQAVYLFANGDRVGADPGTQLADKPALVDLQAAAVPNFYTPGSDPARQTHHPANVRGVQLSLVVRAPSVAGSGGTDTIPAAGNRPDLTGQPVYRRFLLQSSVSTPNLDARGPVYPVWSSATGSDSLNRGGG